MTSVMESRPAAEPTPRERIVRSAVTLIQERGVSGVGLREVVAHAAAPRGSLQHYFPGGKTQLVREAVAQADLAGGRPIRAAREEGGTPQAMLSGLCGRWRALLIATDFALGCPLAATVVDVSATSETLRSAAGEVLTGWQRDAAEVLGRHGFPADRAEALATLVIASVQGALILCRAQRSVEPIDRIEREIGLLLAVAGTGPAD